jgi:hypothetical protein
VRGLSKGASGTGGGGKRQRESQIFAPVRTRYDCFGVRLGLLRAGPVERLSERAQESIEADLYFKFPTTADSFSPPPTRHSDVTSDTLTLRRGMLRSYPAFTSSELSCTFTLD